MPALIEPPPTVAARPAIALRDHMSVVHLAVLAGLCALTLFTSLGSVPLWEPDEPRFAAATRQMLRSGDFLDPVFNGGPRWEKPILLYWLQAAPLAIGLDEELAMSSDHVLTPEEVPPRSPWPCLIAGLAAVSLAWVLSWVPGSVSTPVRALCLSAGLLAGADVTPGSPSGGSQVMIW